MKTKTVISIAVSSTIFVVTLVSAEMIGIAPAVLIGGSMILLSMYLEI